MDFSARAGAFVDETREEDVAPTTDSLPELIRVYGALTRVYAALAERPRRMPAATALLDELWSEYDRLIRAVGEEALARALLKRQPDRVGDSLPVDRGGEVADDDPPSSRTSPPLPEPPLPVSENELRNWAARYRERSVPPHPSSAVVLHAMLDRIGPPPTDPTPSERELEVERLEQATSEEALRELRLLPNEVQRAYLRLLTARLNALRGVSGGDLLLRERVGRPLGIIRDYTREYRPGAVYGLSRDHEPKGGTWEADAHHLWHRLARDDEDAPISRSTPVRTTRRPVEDSGDDEEREAPAPEAEWPFWPFVRDRAVLMVGGAPRESARARIERFFAMKELVWSADDPRKAQSAEARILSGGYDLVLVLLRFMSHSTNEKLAQACNVSGVAYVPVEHGYGVGSIRRSLERFLAPRAAAEGHR